jgi:hypothetical protein
MPRLLPDIGQRFMTQRKRNISLTSAIPDELSFRLLDWIITTIAGPADGSLSGVHATRR